MTPIMLALCWIAYGSLLGLVFELHNWFYHRGCLWKNAIGTIFLFSIAWPFVPLVLVICGIKAKGKSDIL